MKRSIYVLFTVIIAIGILAACAPQDKLPPAQSDQPQVTDQTIKAVIQEVHEHQLLVQPIEGLDDIDIIYLNFGDDVPMNISDKAPLEPGTVVFARVDTAIMESYPPQVHLFEILATEPGTGQAPSSDTQRMPDDYVIGKVLSISGDEYTIEVTSSNLYQGEIAILIPDSITDDGATPIEPGYMIGVYIVAQDNVYMAEKIVFSGPDESEPQLPSDDLISLDDRERISGYLNGVFPHAVYTMADDTITVEAGLPFAIAMQENCESNWELSMQDSVILEADGSDEPREDGYYNHYFAIRIDEPGKYDLDFIHHTADGEFNLLFNVTAE